MPPELTLTASPDRICIQDGQGQTLLDLARLAGVECGWDGRERILSVGQSAEEARQAFLQIPPEKRGGADALRLLDPFGLEAIRSGLCGFSLNYLSILCVSRLRPGRPYLPYRRSQMPGLHLQISAAPEQLQALAEQLESQGGRLLLSAGVLSLNGQDYTPLRRQLRLAANSLAFSLGAAICAALALLWAGKGQLAAWLPSGSAGTGALPAMLLFTVLFLAAMWVLVLVLAAAALALWVRVMAGRLPAGLLAWHVGRQTFLPRRLRGWILGRQEGRPDA